MEICFRPNGNQRLPDNIQSNRTADALISPVSAADLADFIGVDVTDPLLQPLLLTASQTFVDYTSHELHARDYTLKMDRWPERQPGYSGLYPMPASLGWWIDLPMQPVISVDDVTLAGTSVEFEDDLASRPARVFANYGAGPVIVLYRAGYEYGEDIPADILQGIKMLAAYLYEHRGSCEAADPVKASGASMLWTRYKSMRGGL